MPFSVLFCSRLWCRSQLLQPFGLEVALNLLWVDARLLLYEFLDLFMVVSSRLWSTSKYLYLVFVYILMIAGLIGFSGSGVGMMHLWSIGGSVEVWLQFFFGMDEFLWL